MNVLGLCLQLLLLDHSFVDSRKNMKWTGQLVRKIQIIWCVESNRGKIVLDEQLQYVCSKATIK